MSGPKFTPGRWCATLGHLPRVMVSGTGVCIAGVHKIGVARNAEHPEVTVANAHLIAAAPDLYNALVQVRSMCIPGMNWTDETGQLLLSIADAALAKARGEAA